MNPECIWCTPGGYCGPRPSPDGVSLAPCRPAGCQEFEPKNWKNRPKQPKAGGSEEERLP